MARKPKTVTAPKTYKPPKSPKERLAYLNKDEMAALNRFRKGKPVRKGPKGLPSFADDSASSQGVSRGDKSQNTTGSGSTKTSSGSISKGGNYSSQNSGSRNGGASTQSSSGMRGAGSNYGAGSARPGNGTGSDAGNKTSGGMRGAGSNYGAGSGRPGTKSGGYNSGQAGSKGGGASTQRPGMGGNAGVVRSGPQSPMAGQGTSFSSPEAAQYYNGKAKTGKRGPLGLDGTPTMQRQRYSTAAPPGMVGTPRGYVPRADLQNVDAAMQPIAAVGKELPYFTPGFGPLLGRAVGLASEAIPALARTAAPYVSRALSAAERSLSAADLAKSEQAIASYRQAAAAAGRKPGEMAVSMRSLPVTMAQRKAWVKGPSMAERAHNKLNSAIDKTTTFMGHGTGEKARAKAVSELSAYNGLAQGGVEGGMAIGKAYTDSRDNPARQAKSSGAGYKAGGLVRRTFKDK
jgi:hypothetical protein